MLIDYQTKNQKERWLAVLKLAWPLIIANSFWNLQLTIDRIFLGAHATESLGAAMAVMGVFWVPMALLQQTAGYIMTFVAQYFGAKESDKIAACVWQALYLSVVGGIAFIGLNFFSDPFFAFVGHGAKIQALEVEYFNSLAFSALPTALVATISGYYTGLGKTKIVILINFAGLVFNVLFDYMLIFGKFGFPALGIAGAGYATAIATYAACFVGLYFMLGDLKQLDPLFLQKKKFDFILMKQFLKFGLPSGMQWALEGLAFTAFLIIIGQARNGEAALASSSIAVTVMMLSVLPTMGVAQSIMSLVGQKLGDHKAEEAELVTFDGVKLSLIYMLIVAISFWTIPEFYLMWFKNESNMNLWNEVLQLAPKLLAIVALFTIFDSIYLNISFALKGAGDTRFVSVVALFLPWPIMVLPTYLLQSHEHFVVMAWLFAALYSFIITVILFSRFKLGAWKKMSVIH